MSQLSLVCLSLTPNLRCVGFTLGQFAALIIPPVVEAMISLLFIYLYSGPRRWAQAFLAADGILYFIWALLDMLSHVAPAARNSLPVFKALDFFVGAVSFTPILVYLFYLYRLSYHDFIPSLPRNLQPYLEISLPMLSIAAITLSEVSSFVGAHIGTTSDHHLIVEFPSNSKFSWLSLSRSSLATYTIAQFLFFLLAFSRFSRAFLNRRRIELSHSDEHHFFHGIVWINAGIIIGIVETVAGFVQVSFGVVLARRIVRLIARAIFMFGLLKGLDVSENFENLADELHGVSRIGKHISRILGVNPRRANAFRRVSQTYLERSRGNDTSVEKQSGDQRVTVHYEKGQAPFLQIRFSALDFPPQAIFADMIQQRRRSHSGLISGRANGGMESHRTNASDEMAATHEIRKAKPALVATDSSHYDWIQPPEKSHMRQGSGGTVSDSLSIVRDLERKFPSLPPRVTGKYRGSILGQNFEEDPYPVIGVSRQSSMRRDGNAQNASEEGGTSVALSLSGSIKRKPAPPLLDSITYISDGCKRPVSTWGGLAQTTIDRPPDSPVVPSSPWESATVCSSDHALVGEPVTPTTPTTPKSRRRTSLNLIKRASRAVSDASIRSAEWFASASSPQPNRTPLTATDIEMYRRGSLGPGSARLKPSMGEAGPSTEDPVMKATKSSAEAYSKPYQPRVRVPTRTTPKPTLVELESGSRHVLSSHGSANLLDGVALNAGGRRAVATGQRNIDQTRVSS